MVRSVQLNAEDRSRSYKTKERKIGFVYTFLCQGYDWKLEASIDSDAFVLYLRLGTVSKGCKLFYLLLYYLFISSNFAYL